MPGFISGFSILFHWSKCLFLWQYHAVLISIALQLLDCTPQACKDYTCLASRPKKEPRVSDRDIDGLMDRGTLYVWSEVLEWHCTLCGRWWAGHDGSLLSWEKEEVTSYRGNWVRLAHGLPGKLAEGHAPHYLFDKLSWWRCSDLKVRTVTSWGGSKYVGRSVMWVGCRWSRHWSSRGCTESKRTAILSDLTIQ